VTPPLLVAECVGKSYGTRRVLSAGSLRARAGQVGVLFGRNGIGKSTLLKIAAGVVRADSGTVHLDGQFLRRPSLSQLALAGVFYLPDHQILSPSMTLGEQLRLVERRFGARSAEEAARLARVEDFLAARPATLSGGELRRAELALALTRRPRCLLADEPFRGIAPVDHDLLSVIIRGMADEGCAVIVTGHEVASLMALADHITWCTSGTTYELGTPERALAHEAFQREYAVVRAPVRPGDAW
jgi:ABC-type multidrug transport system ATPase subunit